MDGFDFHAARSPEEAVALFARLEAPTYVAGGTDLLPNLKHRIVRPRNLIGISGAVPGGWAVHRAAGDEHDTLAIGGGTRLAEIATGLADLLPPLAQAAGLVAGPQIRNMGTLGGNILLDTRCLFYNQSAFWRGALGHCLKCEGTWCHVIGSERTCVAVQSSDCVPVLLALDASIVLLGPAGLRTLSMRDLYFYNGMKHLRIEPGELLVEVQVPMPGPGFRGSYQKLRRRGSIDFPQLGVAICGRFVGQGENAYADALEIVVGAINPQPRPARGLAAHLRRPLTDDRIDTIAGEIVKQSRPNAAIVGDTDWRRRMIGVFVQRGLRGLRG